MEKFRIGGLAESCFLLAGILIVVIVFLLLTSCKQIEYVTVEKVRNDTTYITKHQRDSIWLHDSVMVQTNGDTLIIDRWHTKYVEKQIHDTTYIATHDTIPQPYPVEKKVPATPSWIQQAKQYLANLVLLLIAAVVIIFVGRRMLRL